MRVLLTTLPMKIPQQLRYLNSIHTLLSICQLNSIPLYESNTLVNLIGILYICIMAKRKKKVINLQNHPESLKAFSWCLERNIRIYPIPSANQFKIVIDNGASKIVSPKLYDKDEWSDKVWELYRHFYNGNKLSV